MLVQEPRRRASQEPPPPLGVERGGWVDDRINEDMGSKDGESIEPAGCGSRGRCRRFAPGAVEGCAERPWQRRKCGSYRRMGGGGTQLQPATGRSRPISRIGLGPRERRDAPRVGPSLGRTASTRRIPVCRKNRRTSGARFTFSTPCPPVHTKAHRRFATHAPATTAW